MFKDSLSKWELKLLKGGSFHFPLSTRQILLLFLAFSFVATSADVALAHSQNRFIPVYEWIPVIYPLLAAGVIVSYLFWPGDRVVRYIYMFVMIVGIPIGLLGLFFHVIGNSVNSGYLWNWFIFGAPVLAPLAITGMCLFGLAIMESNPRVWLRLVALGFLVLALTAFLDHAQTHFESLYTWVPVIAGIFGFLVTWQVGGKVTEDSGDMIKDLQLANFFYAAMVVMIIVGAAGAYFHVITDLHATVQMPWRRFIYHAPVLAPMLFAQLGMLGCLCAIKEENETVSHFKPNGAFASE